MVSNWPLVSCVIRGHIRYITGEKAHLSSHFRVCWVPVSTSQAFFSYISFGATFPEKKKKETISSHLTPIAHLAGWGRLQPSAVVVALPCSVPRREELRADERSGQCHVSKCSTVVSDLSKPDDAIPLGSWWMFLRLTSHLIRAGRHFVILRRELWGVEGVFIVALEVMLAAYGKWIFKRWLSLLDKPLAQCLGG